MGAFCHSVWLSKNVTHIFQISEMSCLTRLNDFLCARDIQPFNDRQKHISVGCIEVYECGSGQDGDMG